MNQTTSDDFSDNLEVSRWAEVLNIIIMMTIVILGVSGNGIIIIVQIRNRERSSTDYYVGTMAVFELFCAGFNSLLIVFNNIASIWPVIASQTLCCIRAYASFLASISSTFLLTALAIDRYVLTCKPFNTYYSREKAKRICVCIVAVSILGSIPTLTLTTFDDTKIKCMQTVKNPVLQNILQLFFGAAYMILFLVVIFCYSKVTILIRRRHQQRNEVRLEQVQASTSKHSTLSTERKCSSKERCLKNKNRVAPEIPCEKMSIEIVSVENLSNDGPSTSKARAADVKMSDRSNEPIDRSADAEIRKIEMKKINRTTLIMFLITTIYILSWVVHWLNNSLVSRATLSGRNVIHLTTNLYMINCVTNPIFFIAMSSKFRRNAKMFFKNIFT